MIERPSPVSCLSGNGGTEMHGYFADNRSQSQSKCLNLWPTITCVCWKKSNITESLFWQFHFAWFLRIYGGKVKKCKHRKAVKYRDELKKNKVPNVYFVDFVTTEAMSLRFAHWSLLQAHCFLAFPLKVTRT